SLRSCGQRSSDYSLQCKRGTRAVLSPSDWRAWARPLQFYAFMGVRSYARERNSSLTINHSINPRARSPSTNPARSVRPCANRTPQALRVETPFELGVVTQPVRRMRVGQQGARIAREGRVPRIIPTLKRQRNAEETQEGEPVIGAIPQRLALGHADRQRRRPAWCSSAEPFACAQDIDDSLPQLGQVDVR